MAQAGAVPGNGRGVRRAGRGIRTGYRLHSRRKIAGRPATPGEASRGRSHGRTACAGSCLRGQAARQGSGRMGPPVNRQTGRWLRMEMDAPACSCLPAAGTRSNLDNIGANRPSFPLAPRSASAGGRPRKDRSSGSPRSRTNHLSGDGVRPAQPSRSSVLRKLLPAAASRERIVTPPGTIPAALLPTGKPAGPRQRSALP